AGGARDLTILSGAGTVPLLKSGKMLDLNCEEAHARTVDDLGELRSGARLRHRGRAAGADGAVLVRAAPPNRGRASRRGGRDQARARPRGQGRARPASPWWCGPR